MLNSFTILFGGCRVYDKILTRSDRRSRNLIGSLLQHSDIPPLRRLPGAAASDSWFLPPAPDHRLRSAHAKLQPLKRNSTARIRRAQTMPRPRSGPILRRVPSADIALKYSDVASLGSLG